MTASTLYRPVPASCKEEWTAMAEAALGAIVLTMSETDDGRRSWILTRGPRTVEVTDLAQLRTAISELRKAEPVP